MKATELALEEFVYVVKYCYINNYISLPIVKEAFEKRWSVHESGRVIYLEHSCNWKSAIKQIEHA